MTRRNWGLATIIAGAVTLYTFVVPWQGGVGALFFLGLFEPSHRASVFWWWGALTVVVGLSLVIVGIALLVSARLKSEKKALT